MELLVQIYSGELCVSLGGRQILLGGSSSEGSPAEFFWGQKVLLTEMKSPLSTSESWRWSVS